MKRKFPVRNNDLKVFRSNDRNNSLKESKSNPLIKLISPDKSRYSTMKRYSTTPSRFRSRIRHGKNKKGLQWKYTGVVRRETFSDTFNSSWGYEDSKKFKLANEREKIEKLKMAVLRCHNKYRSYHESPPLKWSDECYEHAKSWALYLAENREFYYSKDRSNMGENLAMFSSSEKPTMGKVVRRWYSESKYYDYKRHISRSNIHGVCHFTQVIWRNTEEVGLAIVKSKRDGNYYIVANYHPSGNFLNHYYKNVIPRNVRTDDKMKKLIIEENRRETLIRAKEEKKKQHYFFEKHRFEDPSKKRRRKKKPKKQLMRRVDSSPLTEIEKFFLKFGVRTKRMDQNSLDLFVYVNTRRQNNGLHRVKFSPSLTAVAQLHCQDLFKHRPNDGQGNMHSWSDKGEGFFSPVVYFADHRYYQKMVDKPSEICGYESEGYECVLKQWGGNPRKIVKMWERGKEWNIIMNKGMWSRYHWIAMGCAFNKQFACIWFGCEEDNNNQAEHLQFKNRKCFV